MSKVQTCIAHCATCGRHFASDSAFDWHRVGTFDDPNDPRRCAAPIEVVHKDGSARLEERRGECRIYEHREGYGIERDVPIWGDARSRERAKAAFA